MIPGNIASPGPFTSAGGFALANVSDVIIHPNGNITTTGTVTASEFIGPIAYANSAGNANFALLAANANFAAQAANANYALNAANALYAEDSNHSMQADFAVLAANANYSLNAGNAVTSDTANFAANAAVSVLAGHVTNPSQPNITSVGTLSSLAVSGDVVAGNVWANTGIIGAASLQGTLITGAQPGITSVGNLSNLYVAGPGTIEGALLVSDDVAITGNLTISGNLNYTSSNNLSIQSPIIEVGGGPNGAPLTTNDGQDRGLYMHVFDSNVGSEVNKFMGWDTSVGEFRFSSNATIANNVITTNEYGNIRANNFYGNFTGNVSGVAANAIHAQVADVANSVAGANVVGDVVGADHANVADSANSVAGANVIGIVANANYAAFSGVASSANLVAGANVTGEVAHAAVANNVAAANVSGTVANANYAAFSGVAASANAVAGANVSGEVAFAAVANSVAAANVVGVVANANYAAFSNVADSANTVAGANVTGIVANANYAAFSNVADSANAVAGANVSGEVAFAAVANAVAGANVSGYVADATHANIADAANLAYALSTDIANVSITGGNAGEFLKTDGTGNLSWSATPIATSIENGGSNINIPVANGDIELWVAGAWVGNISQDNSNVTSNFTALGNIEGANIVTNGGVFAFDASLTDLYVTSLAQFSDVSNITILGGSNSQVLSTDGTGNLSWSDPGLNYKYTKEWHVDPVNGDDIANDGSYNKPFKTIARAISFTGPTYAQVVYLHAGTYSENVVIVSPTENIEIIGVNDTSTCLCTGTWAFSHTGTSIRVMNIRFNGAVTQTSTGDVYFDNCLFTTSFAKSGASYTEFNSCSVTAASFTSNAVTVARNGSISGLTLNNAGARVYVYNMISVLTTAVTQGQFYAFDTVLFSTTTTTNAITSSAGTIVSLIRCNVTNSSGTASRVSLAGNWTINDTTYDQGNSTLTGTNLGTISYFDALNARGNISAGNITLSGTGTSVNASQGNILTNQITGTKLNLLNGVYTAAIAGGGATSNYTLNLPANVGSNNQVLSSDGTGNLNWQTVSLASTGSNARYVSKNGSDVNGDGSMLKPYLTITAAMNSITDAAPTKRYAIYVNAGEYNEGATLSLKPNVFVVGCDTFAVRIVATTFNMNAGNWSGTSDHRSGFSNCLMIGACDWNWSTVTSGAGKLYFYDVQFSGGTVNLYGHNNATAQAQFWSCVFFGAMTVSGINIGNHMNCRHFANITLNQHPGGGMATILNASGGDCGTVTLTTTVTDFNRRCSLFAKSFYMGGLTVNGASSYADVTNDSLPSAGPTVLNGGNIVYLNSLGATTRLDNLVYPTAVNSPIMPATTSATNLGDWGKQWNWTFSYVYGSTGSDLYVISYGSSYGADTVGRNIGVYSDGAGLAANVNGGNIEMATSAVTGTANSGNIVLTTGAVGTGTRGNVDITTNTMNITGRVSVAGNVLPNASNTYDLGSPTQRWNTLYLSNNTLYLGNVAVGADANSNLTVNGNAIAVVNSNGIIAGTAEAANVAYSVDAANVSGTVANANYSAFVGVVVNASQPNITSVGSLTSLVVSGDATVTGNLNISGNLTYIDVTNLRVQDPVIQLGGGPNGAPLTSNDGKDRGTYLHVYDTGAAAEVDKFMGWDNSNSEFAFGSNVTITNDVVTFNAYGNIHADTFIGALQGTAANATVAYSVDAANVLGTVANANHAAYSDTTLQIANGTSSVSIPVADSNIEMRVNGVMVIDSSDLQTSFLANTVSVQYDLTAGNRVYANSFEASGNITGTNIEAFGSFNTLFLTVNSGAIFNDSVSVGNTLTVSSTLEVTGAANIGANLTVNADSDLVGNVVVGEELYVNNNMTVMNLIQSNTLSVATTANVGALNVGGLSNLGDIANVTITGGNAGDAIITDGTGVLSFANLRVYPGNIGEVYRSDGAGNMVADANFVYDAVNEKLSIGAGITNTGGSNTIVIGAQASVAGNGGIALGDVSSVQNDTGVALGESTLSAGTGAVAIGVGAQTSGEYAIAILGGLTIGDNSITMGSSSMTLAGYSIAMGAGTQTNDVDTIAIGFNTITNLGNAIVLGSGSTVNHFNAIVIGSGLTTTAADQILLGAATQTTEIAGNLNVGGLSNLGDIANVAITGGNSGEYLQTDGTGVLSWVSINSSEIANGTSNVSIDAANGPVRVGVDGTANIVEVGQAQILFGDGATTSFSFDLGGRVFSVVDAANASIVTHMSAGGLSVVQGSEYTTQIIGNSISTQDDTDANVPYSVMTPGFVSVSYGSNGAPVMPVNPEHLTVKQYVDDAIANTANANYAAFSGVADSANAVAGANVSGVVANANYAAFSDVANSATVASSANTVDGANVSGVVANANYAAFSDVANSATVAASANSVAGANVSGQVANALVAGTLYTAAQPNITSVGNLTGLTVAGNALITGNLSVQGNLTYIDVTDLRIQDPVIQLGSGPNGAPLTSNDGKDRGTQLHVYDTGAGAEVDKFMGWKDSAGEFVFGSNITNSNDVITVNAYGNVRASTFIGNLQGLASNATYAVSSDTANSATVAASANSVAGANVSGVVANANYSSFSDVAASANSVSGVVANANYAAFSDVANSATVAASANSVAGANVSGVVANANYAAFSDVANSANSVAGANVSGVVANANYAAFSDVANSATVAASANSVAGANVSGQVANALVAGTVYTAAQPNITSVGTLTGLTISGVSNLNAVSNVIITGGSNGQVLTTNGDGNLSWTTVSGGGGGGLPLANGTSNFNIAIANGNATITSNASTYTFGTDGNFMLPGNTFSVKYANGDLVSLGGSGNISNINLNGNTSTYLNGNGQWVDSVSLQNANVSNVLTATTVSTGNLQLTGGFTETVQTISSSATLAPNIANGSIINFTPNVSFTFNGFTSPLAGQSATVIITQGTGGNKVMTSTMKFVGGQKTLSTAANSIDIISVFYDGSTYYASLTKGYA